MCAAVLSRCSGLVCVRRVNTTKASATRRRQLAVDTVVFVSQTLGKGRREDRGGMPAAPCSLVPPADLTPNPAVRPRSLPSWGVANLTAFEWRKGHDLLFVPKAPPPADGWYSVIRASQFPSVCGRYLLLEDDLSTAGLGWSAVRRHWHVAIAHIRPKALPESPHELLTIAVTPFGMLRSASWATLCF